MLQMADVRAWSLRVRSTTSAADMAAATREFVAVVDRTVALEQQRLQQTAAALPPPKVRACRA
jgi:hypothetical protein